MDLLKLPSWDNYRDVTKYIDDFGKSDGIKHPPLNGSHRYAKDSLYELPWDTVNDAYGKASLTPYYIEAITSDNAGDIYFGISGLESAMTHQGSVYSSAKMAIPFLVDLLKFDNTASEISCHFLAVIALGEGHHIRTPAYFSYNKTKYYGAVKKESKKIKAYYERTNSLEAMRLLCFMPKMLPDLIDLSWDNAIRLAKGNERLAYVRQASLLITQGFIAAERNFPGKGYPQYAWDIPLDNPKLFRHVEFVRNLISDSPSLLVRICAAICLVFSGVVEEDAMLLLSHGAKLHGEEIAWEWGYFFPLYAKSAWLFAADPEMILNTDLLKTREKLTVAAGRTFPLRYTKKEEFPPLEPNSLTELQIKVLRAILEQEASLLGSYEISGLNMPRSEAAAKRMLKESYETLCTSINEYPI